MKNKIIKIIDIKSINSEDDDLSLPIMAHLNYEVNPYKEKVILKIKNKYYAKAWWNNEKDFLAVMEVSMPMVEAINHNEQMCPHCGYIVDNDSFWNIAKAYQDCNGCSSLYESVQFPQYRDGELARILYKNLMFDKAKINYKIIWKMKDLNE